MENSLFCLEKKYTDEMVAHAKAELPDECCGILAGADGRAIKLYRTTNSEHSPFRYSVEPAELVKIYQEIQANRWELLAVYHSHTHTEAYPSPIDIQQAFLPETIYLIVSLTDPCRAVIRGFRIVEHKVGEVELRIQ